MKVVQTVPGKFHHFHLARYFQSVGMLEAIFSSYPRQKLKDQGILQEKLHCYPWWHLLWLANNRYGTTKGNLPWLLNRRMVSTLDSYVSRHLPACDVFVGLSSSGLKTGTLCQKRGGKYICDRGSSHIRYADRIMKEEFRLWGQEYQGVDPFNIAREECEYAQADIVVVPSEFVRRSFIEMGVDEKKIRKVPYGADLKRFSKTSEPDDEFFDVLFVGQVSFRKGIPYLLHAFENFKHPKKRLKIVGKVQAEVKKFLEGKHYDHVEFLGQMPHLQLKDMMSRAHVMVVPSIEEGLAMVQGEALACGCPLISSTHTGGEDLFTDGQEGFFVPIRDSLAMTERLDQLAQDPALRLRMSEAAVRRVESIGGWSNYGALFVKELEALTANRS
jgi:glycosyltransferase involved in cell wall biosynthesis